MIDDSELVNFLLERGIVDQETLKEGMERTRNSGRPLYETLIFARLVEEPSLVEVVAEMLDVPSAKVNPAQITTDVRDLIPASIARRNRVIPLRRELDHLVLGMADPGDELVVDEISTLVGIDVHPVLVGPAAIADAIERVYGASMNSSDDILASFDDLDVASMMDEVMAGDEWSDLFADDDVSVDDSAVLSREMRDRPSTDVLNDEDVDGAVADADRDDDPLDELNAPAHPIAPYASLEDWDVDDAIESGASAIMSAKSAKEFFRPESGARHARLVTPAKPLDRKSEEAKDEVIEEDDDDDTQAGRTSLGVGLDQLDVGTLGGDLVAGTEDEGLDNTGRTSMGVGPVAAPDDEGPRAAATDDGEDKTSVGVGATGRGEGDTDWGALGRAILTTGPSKKAAPPQDPETSEATPEAAELEARESEGSDEGNEEEEHEEAPGEVADENGDRPTDPELSELSELRRKSQKPRVTKTEVLSSLEFDDDRNLGRANTETTRARAPVASFALPEGVDAAGLALALMNLLVERGLVEASEVVELARKLTTSTEDS